MTLAKKTKKTTKKATPKTVAAKPAAKKEKAQKPAKAPKPVLPIEPEIVAEPVPAKKIVKPFTKKELDHYRQLLLEKRIELVGDVDHMGGGILNGNRQESTGELSNMPIHMADVGTDNYEQEFTLGLIESERKLLRDIDDALAKIDNGSYGICEGTGDPIDRSRLEAKPEARFSIEYARMVEKGLVRKVEERRDMHNDDWDDDSDDDSDNKMMD